MLDVVEESVDKLEALDEITVLEELTELDEVDAVEELAGLDRLVALEELAGLARLVALDEPTELDGLDALDALEELSRLDGLDALDELAERDSVEALGGLAELDETAEVDELAVFGELIGVLIVLDGALRVRVVLSECAFDDFCDSTEVDDDARIVVGFELVVCSTFEELVSYIEEVAPSEAMGFDLEDDSTDIDDEVSDTDG